MTDQTNQDDPLTSILNRIYLQNFNRQYDPTNAADAYWASQIKSGKESLGNPYKLAADIASGAQGSDANYYTTMANSVKQNNPITTLAPQNAYAGLTQQDVNATVNAAKAGAPGFSVTSIPTYFGVTPSVTPEWAKALSTDASTYTGLPASSFGTGTTDTPQQLASVDTKYTNPANYTPTSALPAADQNVAFEARLANIRADPVIESSLQQAIAQKIPGFTIAKKGGHIKAKDTRPVMLNFDPPKQYAKGGLAQKAEEVKAAGRGGDTMLVHVNPIEYQWLQKTFGGGTNPHTGLPEFSFWDYILPVAANIFAPGIGGVIGDTIGSITGNALPTALTSALGSAVTGAGINALTGNDVGTGALVGGLSPTVLNSLGLTGTGGSLSNFNLLPNVASKAATASPTAVGNGMGNISGVAGASSSSPSMVSGLMKSAPLLLAAAALGGGLSKSSDQPAAQLSGQTDQNKTKLSNVTFDRTQTNPNVTKRYGYGGEQQFFKDNSLPTVTAAMGTYVKGGGTGTSDSIPAKLSDGEYVIDAQTVSMLGDGSSDAGAKKLDQMREAIRKQKGGALSKGKFAPDAKSPLSYMRGMK